MNERERDDDQLLVPRGDAHRVKLMLANPEEKLCFCLSIPARRVIHMIQKEGLCRVGEIAARCGAGNECTSCRGDIAALIKELTGEQPEDFDPVN